MKDHNTFARRRRNLYNDAKSEFQSRSDYILIVGIAWFIYVLLSVNVFVYAGEIEEEAKEVIESIEDRVDSISTYDEEIEGNDKVLHDTITPLKEDYKTISEDPADYTDRNNVSSNSEENEETMTETIDETKSYNIMIIFALGLVAGVITGHFLTGFIK